MRRIPSAVLCVGVLCVPAACRPLPADEVVLAAPVSLQQSGFTDFVVPAFEREFGVRVKVLASNEVFNLARAGTAHVVIGHDPETEQQLIDEGIVAFYRKMMFNRFLVVGPADDPANVRAAHSARNAFRRIARSGALFVSRGDGSPTFSREQRLWSRVGIVPENYLEVSGDMVDALRAASERQGYAFTVRSVFERLRDELNLAPLFDRDDAMLNTYSLAVRKGGPRAAQRFAEWLAEGQGRPLVERFRVGGRRVFSLWPVTAPSKTPRAVPMDVP